MIFRVLLITLILASSLFAQAKVGTTGDSFLELVPSVRSLGMGGVGAALIDRQSHYSNPATLGLTGGYLISFAFRPVETEFGDLTRHQSLDLSSQVARFGAGWKLSAALQQVGLTTGPFIERTYQQGSYEGTGRTFNATANTYSMTVAVARESRLSYGVGGSLQYIEEDLHDFTIDGYSYDLGAVVSFPVKFDKTLGQPSVPTISLTAGITAKRFGPDMRFVDKNLPLPSALLFALAMETRTADMSLVLSVEEETSQKLANGEASIGLEIGFRDAAWLRAGLAGNRDGDDLTTFGAALSIRNVITKVIAQTDQSHPRQGMFQKVDLIGSYASSSIEGGMVASGADYWQIEIVF